MELPSLAEQLRVNDVEITERKSLLGLNPELKQALVECRRLIVPQLEAIIEEFYQGQLSIPEVRSSIGDNGTLSRLKQSMREYVVSLFGGDYGHDYVNSRLRIGKVHVRIGVAPKLYVSSVLQLKTILLQRIEKEKSGSRYGDALERLFLFDLTLVFDTYVQGLVAQTSLAKDELETYARNLEQIVGERTETLSKLAETDELTGVKNRRALTAALAEPRLTATGRDDVFAAVFLDIDDFKAVNDELGHIAGDQVLQSVAAAFQGCVPDANQVFRYGGDEFVAVFTTDTEDALPLVASALKAQIEQRLKHQVTVSVGVTFFPGGSTPTALEILKAIDEQMFAQKRRHKAPSKLIA